MSEHFTFNKVGKAIIALVGGTLLALAFAFVVLIVLDRSAYATPFQSEVFLTSLIASVPFAVVIVWQVAQFTWVTLIHILSGWS